VAQDIGSYFKSGFHQLKFAPRLIIPFLISEALFYGLAWTIIFTFALFALPVLEKVLPIIEKNQDLLPEIMIENRVGNVANYTDPRIQELEREFSSLFPEMMYILIIFFVLFFIFIIISFVLYAWARAGTTGYIWQGVTTSLDFKNFRYYAKQNLYRIAGLWALIIVFSAILFLIPFFTFIIIPSPLNIIIFMLLMLIFFIIWIIAMLLLFFAEECIVVENKGIIEAIKRSKEIAAGDIGSILLFIFILISVIVIYTITSGVFDLIAVIFNSSLSAFFNLLFLVFLNPWLQLAKLNFFLDRTGRTVRVMEKELEVIKAAKEFIIESPRILVNFAKKNISYILLALYFYVIGFGIGYYIGDSFSFLSEEFMRLISAGYIESKLIGPYISMPFIDLVYYFSNNSIVALNQGLSGLFFVIPSVLGIAVNGIIVGLFYGVLPAETASAFIAVHGVFEITAFVIATAAGIRLGVKFIKGLENENEIIDETIKVVLAALLLIGIAAFLEAFITPIVALLVI